MSFEEIAVIACSVVASVGICAWAYVQAQVKAAIIQQQGIDRRAAAKLGNDGNAGAERVPWYGELLKVVLPELLKSPAVQKMITENGPALLAQFSAKKE
jgi:hypothetical protein